MRVARLLFVLLPGQFKDKDKDDDKHKDKGKPKKRPNFSLCHCHLKLYKEHCEEKCKENHIKRINSDKTKTQASIQGTFAVKKI